MFKISGLAAVVKLHCSKSHCCIHCKGVPGKDCAMQLASKALTKKGANKGRNCKGNTLIETTTTAEPEDAALHQVTVTHMQIHCVPVHT